MSKEFITNEIRHRMLRFHMAVVTADKRLKREIKRVTAATNSIAEFVTDEESIAGLKANELVIVDARHDPPRPEFVGSIPDHSSIAYVVDGDKIFECIQFLADERVVGLLAREDSFDDDEFIASATKSLRRDIFGLHKYFPWGVTTFSMVVQNYPEKNEAIGIVMEYAEKAGMRGGVRERIQLVTDELMMNALYHAPRDDQGHELYRHETRKNLAGMSTVEKIEVEYGCSGRYFGVAVRDRYGSLTRDHVIDYLLRASKGGRANIEEKATGAGLGLISVLHSASKLIFNIWPGHMTEVVALFDTELIAKGKVGARSLHVFCVDKPPTVEEELQVAIATAEGRAGSQAAAVNAPPFFLGRWLLVAVLSALLTALVIAYYFGGTMKEPPPQSPRVFEIVTEPADATVLLNGEAIGSDRSIEVPNAPAFELMISKPGYESWKKTLMDEDVRGDVRVYVNLSPK